LAKLVIELVEEALCDFLGSMEVNFSEVLAGK
jgi:hypothetical protein